MKAVMTKEFRTYFASPIGYIFVAVFMALASVSFLNGSLAYQVADISFVFTNLNGMNLFLIAILTMRCFSEERNKKTDQLLLTSPSSIGEIVLGKYLAALGVLGVTVLISLAFPIILCIYGNPPISEIVGSYLGFILLWGAFISVGVFISAMTESQMIAAVFTFAVLMMIFYMDSLAAGISNTFLKTLVSWVSLMRRFGEFQRGILNISSIIYYISFTFVFLFLTARVIEKRRYS